jgi:hypothetical protein
MQSLVIERGELKSYVALSDGSDPDASMDLVDSPSPPETLGIMSHDPRYAKWLAEVLPGGDHDHV